MLPRAPSAGPIMRQHENHWLWNPFPNISRPSLALLLYHVRADSMRQVVMKCPLCGKATMWKDNPHRPFCSERCSIADLARWASEDYRVSEPLEDIEDTAGQPPEDSPVGNRQP